MAQRARTRSSLRRLGIALTTVALVTSPGAVRAAPDDLSVVYPAALRATVERSLAPAFTEKTGIVVRGRGVPRIAASSAGVQTADVVLATDPGALTAATRGWEAPVHLVFASDAMVLAYPRGSAFATAKEAGTPWFEALANDAIRFGRADPEEDPLGLRSLFVLQLAGRYYDDPGLALRVLRPGQTMPIEALLRRLAERTLDVALMYRSLAVERQLPHLELPVEVNLADPERTGVYDQASVELAGDVHRGAPILLGAARRARGEGGAPAERLLEFLASPPAREALEARGYVIPPPRPGHRDRAPGQGETG